MSVEAQSTGTETKDLDKKAVLDKLSEAFQNVRREAIAHALIEAMYRNKVKIGRNLRLKQLDETIEKLRVEKKIHFMLASLPQSCWDELEEMRGEGMLKLHKHKGKYHSVSIVPGTKLAQVVEQFL